MYRSKSKTIILISIIFMSMLGLSIGYAVVTGRQLTIGGTATAPVARDIDVYFTAYQTSGDGNISAAINANNNKQASFSVTNLVGYGDTAIISYTITNNGIVDATLNITVNTITNTEYFDIESNINNLNGTTINAGQSKTLNIKVKVKKVLINATDTTISANATVTVHAEAVSL